MTEALEPCPFCGSEGDQLRQAFTRATDTFSYWSVECLGCGVEVADDESQDSANLHWNTRQALTASPPAPSPDSIAMPEREDIARLICDGEGDDFEAFGKYWPGTHYAETADAILALFQQVQK